MELTAAAAEVTVSPRRRASKLTNSSLSGPSALGLADLASRSGAGRDSLERLAWPGALDSLGEGWEGPCSPWGALGGGDRQDRNTP